MSFVRFVDVVFGTMKQGQFQSGTGQQKQLNILEKRGEGLPVNLSNTAENK